MKDNKKSRRDFIKKLGGSTLFLTTASSLSGIKAYETLTRKKGFSSNDNIRIGIVGMGIMGFNNVRAALEIPGVELDGVCDLYDGRLIRTKEVFGENVFTTKDYSQLLDRDDVDAIIVATTDHWHDKISIAAMEKGKAVYCEKPMVHHVEEGQAIIDTHHRTKGVFQVGSQRVSSLTYKKAKELYEAGKIGQLVLAETWYDRQSAIGAWQYSIPTDASKETIAWDRYLGDAPKVPFDPKRFFRWRNYRDYGTGVAGDLFVHLFSGLHLILNSKGPERIYATGGLRYWKDGRDVPDVLIGSYDYPATDSHPAFNLQMRVNFIDGSGGGSRINLVGTEGVISLGDQSVTLQRNKLKPEPGYGGWDSFNTFSEAQQKEFIEWYHNKYPDSNGQMKEIEEIVFRVPSGYSDHQDHVENFFEAVRNGSKVIEDATFGMRAAGAALASNMSYFQDKIIRWDPENMKIV